MIRHTTKSWNILEILAKLLADTVIEVTNVIHGLLDCEPVLLHGNCNEVVGVLALGLFLVIRVDVLGLG